jgi:tripartite-type tricarboxylate transporter receptor subunit TctC
MNTWKRVSITAVASLFVLLSAATTAQTATDSYPAKVVRIVVPFAAGGSTDVVARILAEKLGSELKQSFIVENRAGSGGNIGADVVAKSQPDGYTLLMGTTGVMSINSFLYKNLTYDSSKDFDPVIYTTLITNVLVVSPSVPAKSVAELVSLAKSSPGKFSFASSGIGTSTHLSGELFKSMAAIDILHVPYKGSSQALIDVIGGRVTMLLDNAPSALPFIKDGKLRALAVTNSRRLSNLPDVPTIDEAGIKGYESLSWSGIVAPAGTPKAIISKLNSAIDRILKMDDVKQKLAGLGAEVVGGQPEVFAQHMRSEREKWGKLIKTANIVVD